MTELSDRHLRRWYREFNRKWFSGALPEDIDILYAPVAGCCAGADVVECDLSDFVLRVDPACAMDVGIVKMRILHEQAHIKLWPYSAHGPRFEAEMQRLAIAGAFKGLW